MNTDVLYCGRTWYARQESGRTHATPTLAFGRSLCGSRVDVDEGAPPWDPKVDDACLSCTRIYNKRKEAQPHV